MNKNDFINLEKEDLKTLNNKNYDALLNYINEYLPNNSEIKEGKNIKGLYDFMYDYAKNHQVNGCCCIAPGDDLKKIIFDYFEINESNFKKDNFVSLEDIFS